MHLFSLHTQPQLCNITEGKEQALSQLDCRAKLFFFIEKLVVEDTNIYPRLHLY